MCKHSLRRLINSTVVIALLSAIAPQASAQSAPVANPDSAVVAEGGSVTIDVLSNDTGTNGATIESNVSPSATSGWLRVDQTAGTITYTPYIGRNGTDTFAYRLRVPGFGTSTTTVTVSIGDSGPVTPDPDPDPDPDPTPNAAPIADAGPNQTITAGQNVTLNGNGSRDSDGSIASYVWLNGGSQIGTGARPVISNLSTGIYTVTLRVTDNDGAIDTDTVRVTVNAPGDSTGQFAANPDTANVAEGGSVTIDILANDTGTEGATIETNVSPFASSGWLRVDQAAGTITYNVYTGRTGTDTFGYRLRIPGTGTRTTTVTVTIGDPDPVTPDPAPDPTPNSAPIADAGSNQTIASGQTVTLNASGSSDSDGTIASYRWTENGVQLGSAQNVTLSNLATGNHTITLRVTDNDGATDTDTVVVTVTEDDPGGADPFVANPDTATVAEGGSVTINILANDTGADGASIETNVSPYPTSGWRRVDQVAGTITYTAYTGRTGTDTFAYRLRIPGVGTSTTTVTVNIGDTGPGIPDPDPDPQPLPNVTPIADAGSNQSVTAGQNVTLDGSGSRDTDGSIASYIWSQAGSQIGTGVSPVIRNLAAGNYAISLLVTDNEGATDTDTVVVTVNEAQSGNASPIADAGSNHSIQQGEVVTLNATGSSDSDGNITGYVWRENNTIVARGAIASLNGLTEGDYTIQLTVTDNDGATDTDTVLVTVSAAPPAGVLQALADEVTLNIAADGSASVPIFFAANDLGTFDPATFYIATYGTDGTDSKGWVNASQRASGIVIYTPYLRGLLSPTTDYFTYGIRDAQGNRSEATVTINLLPPAPPAGCDAVNSRNKTISLALVGNSLMNEIQQKLTELLVCKGFTSEMGTSNPGGYWWYLHDTNQNTLDLIAQGYDLTLIQEQSSGVLTHSPPYDIVASLKAKIDAAGSEMGFYQTWGLQDREPVKTEAIMSGYEDIANFFNAPIVHIGRAWDYFYTLHSESPPFSLYVDYAHPTQHGKALISYVLYAYLTGESPLGTPTLTLNADDAQLLQTVAWDSYQANRHR